jgi:FAD/FMN-containing dehydrogenase
LPQGNARSYGDSCMNQGGVVACTRFLRRFIAFDPDSGLLQCESGVQLADILNLVEPQGWFLPVTPGTKFATVGGCIANDVHGKNHHLEGSFGSHVTRFELVRTDGTRLLCSPTENTGYFNATIGGLGLTGLISWAELQLKRVPNSAINLETIKYQDLATFFSLSAESESTHEFTAAWIDCLASGSKLGRGHFLRGNHARVTQPRVSAGKLKLAMPIDPPLSLVNSLSLRAFNALYYNRQMQERSFATVHYDPFFYPLDFVHDWNRMYGPQGFLQYQCVVPNAVSYDAIREMLQRIAAANSGSFLVVLKVFGDVPSPGMLSFPRPGATLALDFPYQGNQTLQLFDQLDEVVVQAGGAIYPAKDAHMKADHFKLFYPKVEQFTQYKDPGLSSSFWRRVMEA